MRYRVDGLLYRVGVDGDVAGGDVEAEVIINICLVKDDGLSHSGVRNEAVAVVGVKTEADRREVSALRDKEYLGAGGCIVVASIIEVFAHVVDEHRHTEDVAIEFGGSLHIAEPHLAEVRHIAYINLGEALHAVAGEVSHRHCHGVSSHS